MEIEKVDGSVVNSTDDVDALSTVNSQAGVKTFDDVTVTPKEAAGFGSAAIRDRMMGPGAAEEGTDTVALRPLGGLLIVSAFEGRDTGGSNC